MIKKIFTTPLNSNFFSGYYDKTPLSPNGKFILCLNVVNINSDFDGFQEANVGIFNITDLKKEFKYIISTRAFNWQQGAMLKWSKKFDNSFYINSFNEKNNTYETLLVNIDGIILKRYPVFYAISNDEKYGFCIDFERLYWIRPAYSYHCIRNISKNIIHDINEKVDIYDLSNNCFLDSPLLLDDVKKLLNNNNRNFFTYIEHIMPSPDSSSIAFLYREKRPGQIITYLFTYKLSTRKISLISNSGRLTHYCWKGNNFIVAWSSFQTVFNKLRNKLNSNILKKILLNTYKFFIKNNSLVGNSKISYKITGDSYIIFDLITSENKRILNKLINKDGHPSISPINDDLLLVDCYPDLNNEYSFSIIDLKNELLLEHVKVSSDKSFNNTQFRCDLHPKWSDDGKFICIDTLINGVRGIELFEYN
jgi:hypothetical protein